MAWLFVLVAGLLETAWAFSLKLSHGFTRLFPTLATFALMAASFWLLSLAMKKLPLGTAYTVWTGIGAVGAVLVGIIFLGESASLPRLFCLALILAGIVGLRLTS